MCFFCFKQKTAYEMRISDWSSDVCSSDLLERAEITFTRFFINSTIGMLGLFDIAADSGFPYHEEDFGQTLGTYGTGEGFYLVLPILGPSSLRDGSGRIVDRKSTRLNSSH